MRDAVNRSELLRGDLIGPQETNVAFYRHRTAALRGVNAPHVAPLMHAIAAPAARHSTRINYGQIRGETSHGHEHYSISEHEPCGGDACRLWWRRLRQQQLDAPSQLDPAKGAHVDADQRCVQ